jgi:hypothetical protein
MSSLTVQMALDITVGAEAVTGTIGEGTWTADLLAKRAAFNAKTNMWPYEVKYTVVLPGSGSADSPAGYSYGAASVDKSGKLKFTGSLADSTAVGQSALLAGDGSWPLYANLYGGKGVLEGWLTFDPTGGANKWTGTVRWVKEAQAKAKFYPGGFSNDLEIATSSYAPASPILPLTSGGTVSFSGGNVADFSNSITVTADNKVVNQSENRLTLSFVLPSGLFNGSVTPPDGTRARPFHGAVLQNSGVGYGYFLGTNQSGSVMVGP